MCSILLKLDSNLSIVIATIFHVDAQKSAQRKYFVFHKRHSSCPRIPRLWTLVLSSRVKVNMNRMTDAKKSMTLWNNNKKVRQSYILWKMTNTFQAIRVRQDRSKTEFTWIMLLKRRISDSCCSLCFLKKIKKKL